MKLKTIIILGAVIVGSSALLGCSPETKSVQAHDQAMADIASNEASIMFSAGVMSYALALRDLPELSNAPAEVRVKASKIYWDNMRKEVMTNGDFKAP